MIVREILNEKLERHYSDAGFKIQKVGTDEIYDDAIDVIAMGYEYVETEEPLEEYSNDEYIKAAKILLGEE